MIVLIEGLNRTGKSTLAQNLSNSLQIPIVKFDVPGPDPYFEFTGRLQEAMRASRHFIIDRLHLSNFAYNGILGGGVLSSDEWDKVDQILGKESTLLYWMVDTPQAIQARLQAGASREDGAETLDRAWLAMMHGRFDSAFRRTSIRNKGSFTLPQFVEDGKTTPKFEEHLHLLRAVMAGVAY